MKYITMIMMVTMLFGSDIFKPGPALPFTPEPDVSVDYIGFANGYAIDTRVGEPALPAALHLDAYDPQSGYYLVQLRGPILESWTNALKSLGLTIIAYFPNYTYLVRGRLDQYEAARNLDCVKWTGLYQPAYKVPVELLEASGAARLTIQLFPDESCSAVRRQLEAMGISIVEVIEHELCTTIDVRTDRSRVPEIARLPAVHWVQEWSQPVLFNDNSQWVNQTGHRSSVPSPDSVARRSWFKGVRGQGVVTSTSDSGIHTSHYQFYDSAYPITAPGVFPNHRKIVAYKLYSGAAFGDVSAAYWHGTHTGCTTCGNDTTLGTSARDGQAKEAKMYHCDIGDASGGLVVSTNLTPMYDTIYLGRGLSYNIYQHSGSWGWSVSTGDYQTQEATTDAYHYRYPRFLSLYSAGNSGSSGRTIGRPGLAKNVLTIGACGNGTSATSIASFSSRGYTADRRIKPNIMAPGVTVYSAQGGTTNSYWSMDGTSMSCPNANGTVALMRQYLMAGYYPSGVANPADSIKVIHACLLRAMTMVSADPNVGSWNVPDSNIGWGRVDAESVLYYPPETRKLILRSDTIGLTTGTYYLDSFMVNSSTVPLRACLAWIDTAAAVGAARTLVNNLNLELTNAGGTSYHGNIYASGQSTANPSTWDTVNVEECCRINAPTTGKWKIYVRGINIPNAPMGYAYVITGDITRYTVEVEETTQPVVVPINAVSYSTISRGRIELKVNLLSPGLVEARIYDLTGRVAERFGSVTLPTGESVLRHETKLASGVYFLEVRTATDSKVGKLLIIR